MHFLKSILCVFSAAVLTVFITGSCFAQKLPPGPQVLSFFSNTDDTEQPYALYLPKKYSEKKKYPLVIMLHGAGSNHRLALRRVFGKSNAPGETDVEASLYFPEWKDVNYIVAVPYARGTAGYQGFVEKDIYDMLADIKKRFKIDENRIYLTGLSMGGGGTLWLGLTRPDIWAAIAPVCPATPEKDSRLANNLLHVPAHFFHGDSDKAVPVKISREWVKHLEEAEFTVEYREYAGVEHNSWELAYANGYIFSWFDKFRRNPYPDRARFVSYQYKYNRAYWVQLDRFTPEKGAAIDARFTGNNQIVVNTLRLDAFTLLLKNHPKFKSSKPLHMQVDGQKFHFAVKDAAHFSKKDSSTWTNVQYLPPAGAKQPGAEGPIGAAFAERHVYVYGTLDNPPAEVLKARMDTALRAADWSVDRGWFLGRVKFYPRVIADKDVRPSDLESSNLILFGNKVTNSIIAKYSDRLPMELEPNSKDYGLMYIFPIEGRYVVVSSGLPWWTGAEMTGFRFLPPAQGLLSNLKDYIFFKGSAKNVLSEGYFNENWRLPETAVPAFKESGVVKWK